MDNPYSNIVQALMSRGQQVRQGIGQAGDRFQGMFGGLLSGGPQGLPLARSMAGEMPRPAMPVPQQGVMTGSNGGLQQGQPQTAAPQHPFRSRRADAQQWAMQNLASPAQNVGEGISRIGQGIAMRRNQDGPFPNAPGSSPANPFKGFDFKSMLGIRGGGLY